MNNSRLLKALCIFFFGCSALSLSATTWYVRPDGGTRYSANNKSGQCDGKGDAAYSGRGANQHCAFKEVRYLYQDGTYTTGTAFPSWGWVIAGGDTVILRGSIATGASYRIGAGGSGPYCATPTTCWGLAGDQFNSFMPPPPPGTASQHTRILGENYAACHTAAAKTQLHGGWGLAAVINLSGASYVDLACLDVTDFSACGRASQAHFCNPASDDFANNGILLSNATNHLSLTDLNIHGLGGAAIFGPTGDGVVLDYVDMVGNASSGWNADLGNNTTGVGSLNVSHYNISWNGCAEEYPITHPLPYGDCTDQDHGGYGDGFGTTTVDSPAPGWQVHFDEGVVAYNTQDGLDALHIGGPGSSMTVTNTLAYGNMGQQIKVGGTGAVITDNRIVGNCRAMSKAIPGTPPGFNAKLDLFCRAGDVAIVVMVPPNQPAIFKNNVIFSNNSIALEIEYPGDKSTPTSTIQYDNNIFVGFPQPNGELATPIFSSTDLKMFTNPGASFKNNYTYHAKSNWRCPATSLHEVNGRCSAPPVKDLTWHEYGFGDMTRAAPGTPSSEVESPEPAEKSERSWLSTGLKSLGVVAAAGGLWKGYSWLRSRSDPS